MWCDGKNTGQPVRHEAELTQEAPQPRSVASQKNLGKSGNASSAVFGTCRRIPAPNPLYCMGLGAYRGEKETQSQRKPMVIKVKTVVISRRGIFGCGNTRAFWNAGNGLCLDVGDDYIDVYMRKTLCSLHLIFVYSLDVNHTLKDFGS